MSDNVKDYSGASIEVLKGLEPVRRRPGMYTDTQNPNHLGMEVIDNSVDEAVAGFANKIDVVLYEDESLEVTDNGRGMPVDLHPEEKIPAIELILTRLHAGGKFNSDSYKFSGGLHGVGVSVVNALSKKLIATVKRGGIVYQITYEGGNKTQELTQIGTCAKKDTGTSVHFWPDEPYFDEPKFNVALLKHLLKAKAVLCEGVTINFEDKIRNTTESWSYNGNLQNYMLSQTEGRTIEPNPPFFGEVKGEDEELEWAVAWELEGTGAHTIGESFVNLIPTVEGGTHVNGFRAGLTDAIKEFCDLQNLLPRNLKITADDVWSHCSYVLSLKMRDPQFAGQTKEKLSSRHIASIVQGIVSDRFSLWLNSNVNTAKVIANAIIEAAKDRESTAKVVERKKTSRGPALPGKLTDCTSSDPSRCELFIVEGDSAGGSARQARDSSYQAILPLRGKILNTWETSAAKAMESEEIRAISIAIGVDPDADSLDGLRYDKICILADADCDGLHIGTLLCCLFVKHFTRLVREGHIYVACPPLFRIDAGKYKEYAIDEAELDVKQKQFLRKGIKKDNIKIQRFKGLGEMNPDQLRETTLAPESRRLKKLTLTSEADENTFAIMDLLLSQKRAADRRQWIEDNGDKAEMIDQPMADTDDKTEQPTSKKLDDARKKGQVPRSKEAGTFFVLLAGVLSIWAFSSFLGKGMRQIMLNSFTLTREQIFSEDESRRLFVENLLDIAIPLIGISFVVFVCAIAGSIFIGGYNFSKEALQPKFSKLNPIKGIGRIFSLNAIVELVKGIFKVAFIGSFCYFALSGRMAEVMSLSYIDPIGSIRQAIKLLFQFMVIIVCSLCPIVLLDVPYQKWNYIKQLRMSKQEIKDEFKDTEGNPQIKGKIKQLQYQMAARRMMKKVPEADVVVTNPTHYAVALKYDPNGTTAPLVVAKGVDEIAEKIKEIARESEVPVIPLPPLARSLYYTTDLDSEIPRGLFKAVAQVLAWVMGMKSFKEGKSKQRPRDLDMNLPIPDELKF